MAVIWLAVHKANGYQNFSGYHKSHNYQKASGYHNFSGTMRLDIHNFRGYHRRLSRCAMCAGHTLYKFTPVCVYKHMTYLRGRTVICISWCNVAALLRCTCTLPFCDISLTLHLSITSANEQLDAQIFNTFITILYMFRAISCSSSGGQIVLTHWGRGHLNCLNVRSRDF